MHLRLLTLLFLILAAPAFAEENLDDFWNESYRQEALGKYQAAMEVMNNWLHLHPNHEFSIMRRGWLYYLQGKHNESIKDYQKALSLNDKSLEARLGMMLPLMAQNKWREAMVYGRQIDELAPWNYYAHVRMLRCEEALEQWNTLADHALQVYLRYPSDATIIVYLARAYEKLGNARGAEKAWLDVLERVPGHVEASQYLASHHRR